MEYTARDGERYTLNLIDTPGHVDFSYEVSRAIASCEGALLVVDATQGIQAQTISNLYLAVGHDLEIVPVLNKIDMESAMIDEVKDQVIDLIGCREEDILLASGKTGAGVEEILEAIVQRIPAPKGDDAAPLQALIFDSVFNPFRGIIAYFRVFNGTIRKGEHVKFFNTGSEYDADEVGVLKLKMQPRDEIRAGDVGYICSGIKTSADVKVATRSPRWPTPRRRPSRASRMSSRWSSRASIPSRRTSTRTSGLRSKAAAQRRLADLRARELAGARLRLPLRIPRPAAHGDHPGAPLPRVRHGRHHHCAERLLPRHDDAGRAARGPQPLGPARDHEDRQDRGALHPRADHHQVGVPGQRHQALHRQARRDEEPDLHHAGPRGGELRHAPLGDRLRLLRQAQEHLERLRIVRLPPHGLPALETRQAGHPAQWRAG